MAKSGRHKKIRRQEKNKVKVKLGKKLPKGANITDTSFKAKKIVIKEQLKPLGDEDPNIRKFKDLILNLNHYNVGTRAEGITSLAQLLGEEKAILFHNLGTVVEKAAKLLLDKEQRIHKEAVKLFQVVLRQVSTEQLMPFTSLIVAHLKCAMNHLDKGIQYSSLLLLEAVMENHPLCVKDRCMDMLPNFLDQISQSKDASSQGERMLSVNPNSKVSPLHWRLKVLTIMHRFLTLFVHREIISNEIPSFELNDCRDDIPIWSNLLSDTTDSMDMASDDHELSEDQLKKFASLLIPILKEVWIEALGSCREKNGVSFGKESDFEIVTQFLDCMVNIMITLWQMCSSHAQKEDSNALNEFSAICEPVLKTHFLGKFPYSFVINLKKKSQNAGNARKVSNTVLNCRVQNLKLLHLTFIMVDDISQKVIHDSFQYISECSRCKLSWNELKEWTSVIGVILCSPSVVWSDYPDKVMHLIDHCVDGFTKYKSETKEWSLYLGLLSEIMLKGQSYWHSSPSMERWLAHLPLLLIKREAFPFEALELMQNLGSQCNVPFTQSLLKNLPEILGNWSNIQVKGLDVDTMQNAVVSLFYCIPEWSADAVNMLQTVLNRKEIAQSVVSYLQFVLTRKMKMCPEESLQMLKFVHWNGN